MNNITKVVKSGLCTGCRACNCDHITFEKNNNGFPSPVVDQSCTNCGECLKQCIYFDENDD